MAAALASLFVLVLAAADLPNPTDPADPTGPVAPAAGGGAVPAAALPAAGGGGGEAHEAVDDISLDEWKRDDWMLVRPKTSLFELGGFLRLRGDLLRRLDFGNATATEVDRDGAPRARYPAASDGHADFGQASLRLRLEPRINVSEAAQIGMTVDMLENLVLGATPETLVHGRTQPQVGLLSGRQVPPRRLDNALVDSVAVKRLWGRISALNEQVELQVGRLPDQWGLGMLYNSGDCLDCNWGTVVDRLALSVRLFDHIFTPMVDWVAKGPQILPFGAYDPAPLDVVGFDDAMQYSLRIRREDHPDDIHDATLHGRRVFNYGLSNSVRLQARDVVPSYAASSATASPADPNAALPATANAVRRDGLLYVGDAYGRLYVGFFELAAEAAVEAGSYGYTLADSTPTTSTQVLAAGGAVEARYALRGEARGVRLALKLGGATGDSDPGFGALDSAQTQRLGDGKARGFQFHPDYHLDLLMFRRVIGTVTDAVYVRPEVAYRFDDRVLGRLNAVYSQAAHPSSTPSARGGERTAPLGVEFDGEVFYGSESALERAQLLASVAGGILFPLGAFDNPSLAPAQRGGSFAWTVQARMYLTF